MPTLAEALRAWSDADLARLLTARPDLANPAPSSITALATRAGARASVDRALAGLTRFEEQVAEAIVALADGGPGLGAVSLADVEAGLGVEVAGAVGRLRDLALVVGDGDAVTPVRSLAAAFGSYPAGLGPRLDAVAALHPGEDAPSSPVTPEALEASLADAPEAALRVLDALRWGPPIGTVEAGEPGPGTTWLLARGILRRLSPTQLVLPREVALAARGGRLLREVEPAPVIADAPVRSGEVVAAESARAAAEIVHLVGLLLTTWDDAPPSLLRAGGLGVRELRRVSVALDIEAPEAAFVVELAAMAGLIGQVSGEDGPTWVATRDSDAWREGDLPERWARLVRAWVGSTRAPWLVGTRDEREGLRAALGPGMDRVWASDLRRRALSVLTAWPVGAAPSDADAYRALAWAAPRATPRLETVTAVLREVGWLGLTGAGALASAGRALLAELAVDPAGPTPSDSPTSSAEDGGAGLERAGLERAGLAGGGLEGALAADLPPVVDDLVIQADLTGLVAGRASRALGTLLDAAAEVESRGAALTVRFTPGSIARAVDAGFGAEALTTDLQRHSRTPLPQPLEYLIRDVARRHAAVRVGVATSYIRSEDAAGLAALVADSRLAGLHLRSIATTVLVSPQPAAVVREGLRSAGVGAVVEGPDGAVVSLTPEPLRAPATPGAEKGPGAGGASTRGGHSGEPDRLARIVAAMRAGEEQAAADGRVPGAGSAPAQALAVLREAAESTQPISLVVAGPSGKPERRLVRVLSVEGGRVRAVDTARQVEITVAVHRIVDAHPPGT